MTGNSHVRQSKTALYVVAGAVVLAVVILGMVLLVRAFDASDRRDADQERTAVQRANTVCGQRPAAVDYHESGWSHGPYWKVQCPDGSVAIVRVGG